MDFFKISEKVEKVDKEEITKIYPDFRIIRSEDLMVRGKSFYAIWDEEKGLWSTDEYDVQRLVDQELLARAKKREETVLGEVRVNLMGSFLSNSWKNYRSYLNHLSDSYHELDERLVWSNTEIKKTDYVSRRLPYSLQEGECPAYEEIISTLYNPDDRAKIEWAIGAVISGDAKKLQKFLVLYGDPGTGKGTIIEIIQKLFEGYYTTFESKALGSSNNSFATEAFRSNPLVAIEHDGDLSRIDDNTRLNSIISHEYMTINPKFKSSYMARVNAFLFMATNKPVKISDAKSGIIRRLIDTHPSGRTIPEGRYHVLMSQIDFELGAIANRCLDVYRSMGKDYYSGYRPIEMMLLTDIFYNFIEEYFDVFKDQGGVSLVQAYEMYKTYCSKTNIEFKLPRYKFREELKSYFHEFHERRILDGGERVRSWYEGFISEKFMSVNDEEHAYALSMEEIDSIFDELASTWPAQYATSADNPDIARRETPRARWSEVSTTLKDIDTHEVHYVKPPENHIVIDFDLKDEYGEKSAERNIEAASRWPSTYAEWSKGGAGIHLHYNYTGDVSELSRIFSEGIEVKVFTGDASLRRRLSHCNNVPVAGISSGLPLKEKKVLNFDTVKSEMGIRNLIERNLRKEIHPGTKPSIDFIHKILEDAYSSGLVYDVTDMRQRVLAFASNSSNQALYCLKLVNTMKWASEVECITDTSLPDQPQDEIIFFDTEVFPNLFHISWKYKGSDKCVHMTNPTSQEVEKFIRMRGLVGFNNRRYDNHMLYAAAFMGYSVAELYKLSKRLIDKQSMLNAMFREAYNLSYTDIYDFSNVKKSLKRWQIDKGIRHQELGLDWDKPVPEELIPKVIEYCDNDVISEEVVFDDRAEDFLARQILADLSGLTVNHTTQQHTYQIVFGNEKKPQEQFIYTDLSEMFPGYVYDAGKSTYRGEEVGEGGYVYAEPGMYTNVALLDVQSMHPTSIKQMNMFGPFTKNYTDLLDARIAIKHEDYDAAKKMLNGVLEPYLSDKKQAKNLSYALKIVVNIVYGLTSAKFDNKFRDPRNKDNIVAKRGALFMVDLKHAVQERGFTVAHIKTDSIKIPNATQEIIEFVMEFGKKYGYIFEHEATYDKFCLVNDAVYIAKVANIPWEKESVGGWTATGAQFQHPYVFKTLFSHEPIEFSDKCETKQVTTALYLDYDSTKPMFEAKSPIEPTFIGKAGSFCPMKEGTGGGILLREKDGKYHSAPGSKGYFWQEAEVVEKMKQEDDIDLGYFNKLVDDAVENIAQYGDFEWFISDDNLAKVA